MTIPIEVRSLTIPFNLSENTPASIEEQNKEESPVHALPWKNLSPYENTAQLLQKVFKLDVHLRANALAHLPLPPLTGEDAAPLMDLLTNEITITGANLLLNIKTTLADLLFDCIDHGNRSMQSLSTLDHVGSNVPLLLITYFDKILQKWGATPDEASSILAHLKEKSLSHPNDIDFSAASPCAETRLALGNHTKEIRNKLAKESHIALKDILKVGLKTHSLPKWDSDAVPKMGIIGMEQQKGPDIQINFHKDRKKAGFFYCDSLFLPLRRLILAWIEWRDQGGNKEDFLDIKIPFLNLVPQCDQNAVHQSIIDLLAGIMRLKDEHPMSQSEWIVQLIKKLRGMRREEKNPPPAINSPALLFDELMLRAKNAFPKQVEKGRIALVLAACLELENSSLASDLIKCLVQNKIKYVTDFQKDSPLYAIYQALKTNPNCLAEIKSFLLVRGMQALCTHEEAASKFKANCTQESGMHLLEIDLEGFKFHLPFDLNYAIQNLQKANISLPESFLDSFALPGLLDTKTCSSEGLKPLSLKMFEASRCFYKSQNPLLKKLVLPTFLAGWTMYPQRKMDHDFLKIMKFETSQQDLLLRSAQNLVTIPSVRVDLSLFIRMQQYQPLTKEQQILYLTTLGEIGWQRAMEEWRKMPISTTFTRRLLQTIPSTSLEWRWELASALSEEDSAKTVMEGGWETLSEMDERHLQKFAQAQLSIWQKNSGWVTVQNAERLIEKLLEANFIKEAHQLMDTAVAQKILDSHNPSLLFLRLKLSDIYVKRPNPPLKELILLYAFFQTSPTWSDLRRTQALKSLHRCIRELLSLQQGAECDTLLLRTFKLSDLPQQVVERLRINSFAEWREALTTNTLEVTCNRLKELSAWFEISTTAQLQMIKENFQLIQDRLNTHGDLSSVSMDTFDLLMEGSVGNDFDRMKWIYSLVHRTSSPQRLEMVQRLLEKCHSTGQYALALQMISQLTPEERMRTNIAEALANIWSGLSRCSPAAVNSVLFSLQVSGIKDYELWTRLFESTQNIGSTPEMRGRRFDILWNYLEKDAKVEVAAELRKRAWEAILFNQQKYAPEQISLWQKFASHQRVQDGETLQNEPWFFDFLFKCRNLAEANLLSSTMISIDNQLQKRSESATVNAFRTLHSFITTHYTHRSLPKELTKYWFPLIERSLKYPNNQEFPKLIQWLLEQTPYISISGSRLLKVCGELAKSNDPLILETAAEQMVTHLHATHSQTNSLAREPLCAFLNKLSRYPEGKLKNLKEQMLLQRSVQVSLNEKQLLSLIYPIMPQYLRQFQHSNDKAEILKQIQLARKAIPLLKAAKMETCLNEMLGFLVELIPIACSRGASACEIFNECFKFLESLGPEEQANFLTMLNNPINISFESDDAEKIVSDLKIILQVIENTVRNLKNAANPNTAFLEQVISTSTCLLHRYILIKKESGLAYFNNCCIQMKELLINPCISASLSEQLRHLFYKKIFLLLANTPKTQDLNLYTILQSYALILLETLIDQSVLYADTAFEMFNAFPYTPLGVFTFSRRISYSLAKKCYLKASQRKLFNQREERHILALLYGFLFDDQLVLVPSEKILQAIDCIFDRIKELDHLSALTLGAVIFHKTSDCFFYNKDVLAKVYLTLCNKLSKDPFQKINIEKVVEVPTEEIALQQFLVTQHTEKTQLIYVMLGEKLIEGISKYKTKEGLRDFPPALRATLKSIALHMLKFLENVAKKAAYTSNETHPSPYFFLLLIKFVELELFDCLENDENHKLLSAALAGYVKWLLRAKQASNFSELLHVYREIIPAKVPLHQNILLQQQFLRELNRSLCEHFYEEAWNYPYNRVKPLHHSFHLLVSTNHIPFFEKNRQFFYEFADRTLTAAIDLFRTTDAPLLGIYLAVERVCWYALRCGDFEEEKVCSSYLIKWLTQLKEHHPAMAQALAQGMIQLFNITHEHIVSKLIPFLAALPSSPKEEVLNYLNEFLSNQKDISQIINIS